MAIYKKKDGGVLEIPDDVSDSRRSQILAEEGIGPRATVSRQPRPTGGAAAAKPADQMSDVERKQAKFNEMREKTRFLPGSRFLESMASAGKKGYMASLSDELSGAVGGVIGGVKGAFNDKGIIQGAKEGYQLDRNLEREVQERAQREHPGLATTMEVAGSLGPGNIGEQIVTRALPKAAALATKVPGAAKVAKALGTSATAQLAAKVAASPIAQAAGQGAAYGAVNAVGENEDITALPGDAVRGATMGGITGGVFGLGGRLIQHGADFLRSNADENVENKAYGAVGKMLDRINQGGSEGTSRGARAARRAQEAANPSLVPGELAAQQAETRLGRSAAQGNDEIVADLSPSLRGTYGGIARNTKLDVANDIGMQAENRALGRPDRFVNEATKNVGDADAVARRVEIQQARKAAGHADYNDAVMNKPFVWNDRLEDLTTGANASEDIKSGLRQAASTIRNTYGPDGKLMSPEALGWKFNAAGDVEYMQVPNMDAFNLLKKGFDADIQAAGVGTDKARRISTALNLLKQHLGEANPGYAKALANQRDLFQKEQALGMGQKVLSRLKSNMPGQGAKELMAEIKGLPPHMQDDYKTGIVDALTRMDSKQNPMAVWDNMYRSKDQRQVLDWALGGKQEAQRFNRWVRRERNSAATDIAGNTKTGSITSNALLADEATKVESNPLLSAFHGWAFNGPIGGIAGGVRGFANLMRGRTEKTQELMGQILRSKGEVGGEKISEGIRRTGLRVRAKEAQRLRALRLAGRGSQQLTSGLVATKPYDEEQ